MIILGINGGTRPGYQDTAAALCVNGEIVAAIEEERLNRIKHSPGQLPLKSVEWVLQAHNIPIKEVDLIASHGSTWGDDYQAALEEHFRTHFGFAPPIKRFHHHDCHAASAFYGSGFAEAMILTVDGSGDGVSTQLSHGSNGQIENLERYSRPHSLGIFYSAFTQFCGFTRDWGEYKLMGLASYGERGKYNLDWFLKWSNGKYVVDDSFLKAIPAGAPQPPRHELMYSEEFTRKMGAHRLNDNPVTKYYEDVAASAQETLEEMLMKLVESLHEKTGSRNLCLAGGVALNCEANRKLADLPFVDNIYIQPASSDAGIPIGATWLAAVENDDKPIAPKHVYLGPEFSDDEIFAALNEAGVEFSVSDQPEMEAAKMISNGKVIGWFQGRMEFGPRALGNRSILANATVEGMDKTVNKKIKFRESFRPLCPSVLEEDIRKYFTDGPNRSHYMTLNYKVHSSEIPAVTHVDKTARIQTVGKENAKFRLLLEHLKVHTGHSVVLNTSFNRKDEPIVNTPQEAIAMLFSTGMDALVIGNCIAKKEE